MPGIVRARNSTSKDLTNTLLPTSNPLISSFKKTAHYHCLESLFKYHTVDHENVACKYANLVRERANLICKRGEHGQRILIFVSNHHSNGALYIVSNLIEVYTKVRHSSLMKIHSTLSRNGNNW